MARESAEEEYWRLHRAAQETLRHWAALDGGEEAPAAHKQALRRRLVEARYPPDVSEDLRMLVPRFATGVLAVERFRDMAPAVVVALFERHLVLEPGDVGPLPYADGVAQEILRCVNGQSMSPALLEVVRRAGGALYDGCAVVGVVDYRPWAFATRGGPRAPAGTDDGRGRWGAAPHEMRKILLHSDAAVLGADVHGAALSSLGVRRPPDEEQYRIAFEARVVLATAGPLCLEPSPAVFRRLRAAHYDVAKKSAVLRPRLLGEACGGDAAAFLPVEVCAASSTLLVPAETVLRTLHADEDAPSTHAERFVRRLLRPVVGVSAAAGPAANSRFRLLSAAEDADASRRAADAEPLYGLDARRDPARLGLSSPPHLSWVQPGHAIYRTLRFESRPAIANVPPTHHTLHVTVGSVASPQTGGAVLPRFEAVLRIGAAPCANDLVAPVRRAAHAASATSQRRLVFATGSRAAAEAYVEAFRLAMAAEGRTCVADVSNPSVFAGGQHQPAAAPLPHPRGHGVSSAKTAAGMPHGAATPRPFSHHRPR